MNDIARLKQKIAAEEQLLFSERSEVMTALFGILTQDEEAIISRQIARALDGSLDEAFSLFGKRFPKTDDYRWRAHNTKNGCEFEVMKIYWSVHVPNKSWIGKHRSLPLAILLAMLEAVEATDD